MMFCSVCQKMVSVHRVDPVTYKCRECGHNIKRKGRMLQSVSMGTYGHERKW